MLLKPQSITLSIILKQYARFQVSNNSSNCFNKVFDDGKFINLHSKVTYVKRSLWVPPAGNCFIQVWLCMLKFLFFDCTGVPLIITYLSWTGVSGLDFLPAIRSSWREFHYKNKRENLEAMSGCTQTCSLYNLYGNRMNILHQLLCSLALRRVWKLTEREQSP